ncbi:hypothetical protein DYB26_013625 [Aphanomyces astaci]|uniref:Radical SAM core domain-containing protein n=1 Tax=Aphanomyces astaci TaxID=112090 RepID=A0A397BZ55_APHAT|nr:hypothetical protein DYB38_001915 [Aphanomyces astaci]RHZ39089.1 hypothetical protein DYB26_013625 [Aphanomyces astaci]
MVKKRVLSPAPLLDTALLTAFVEENGLKLVHAQKIWKHISTQVQAQSTADISVRDIPHLPSHAYPLLEAKFAAFTTTVAEQHTSSDGTVKLLITLQDGHNIEAVIMKHSGRNTLCVSSQVGCQMGCTFCATGTMGIIADLCAGEILEQLAHAFRVAPIRNVVFMGMGEPLNNYDAVLAAIRAMTDVFGLAPKYITLSTVGVIHRIRQLKEDAPLVRLALSLHAPTQDLRVQIVPTAKAYPLDKLMLAIDDHLKDRDNRMVMMEYIMLKHVNVAIATAHDLGKLLAGKSVVRHINLIPYNATDVDAEFQSPTRDEIVAFKDVLRTDYNLKVTLAVKKLEAGLPKSPSVPEQRDIEDLGQRKKTSLKTTKKQPPGKGDDASSSVPTLLLATVLPIVAVVVTATLVWRRLKP